LPKAVRFIPLSDFHDFHKQSGAYYRFS